MTLSTLLVILVLGAAAIFAYQNPALMGELYTVSLPGGTQSVPLIAVIVSVMVSAVVLLWLIQTADLAVAKAGRRRAERRLTDRERELAAERARVQEETGRRLDDLSRRIDQRWGRPPAAPATTEPQEQTTIWRRTGS